jgi:serine O-acetyltransferase
MFENLREDWHTYEGDIFRQGLWVMVVYRFGRWRYRLRSHLIRRPLSLLYKIMKIVGRYRPASTCPVRSSSGAG